MWAAGVVATSVVVLVIGSQLARWTDQDVDWYTGFGQWLGAIASLLAAGAALWIATSDRRGTARRAREERTRAREDERVRLERVASLVRVSYEGDALFMGNAITIVIENLRQDVIVNLEVTKYVIDGVNYARAEGWLSAFVDRVPRTADGGQAPLARTVPPNSILKLRPQTGLHFSDPRWVPEAAPSLIEITYLDTAGLRWRVDSSGKAVRIPDHHDPESRSTP